MVVFIRHGKKAWKNGERASFDPPLLDGNDVRQLVTPGIKRPERIICSPFLRCRQTALILSDLLGGLDIEVDSDLREYLGNWPQSQILLEPTTQSYILGQVTESFEVFQERVLRVLKKSYFYDKVWIVTHGIVIRTLAEAYGKPCPQILEAGIILL